MKQRALGVLLAALLPACSGLRLRTDERTAEHEGHTLPLRRVRLYASGVGYFERRGRLEGDADVLPVPSSHLDDALKSLVLLTPEAKLDSVSFASRLSPAVARARAGLPAEEDQALSHDRLLVSLRGERVEVRAQGQRVRGRVVEVVAVGPSHPTYLHKSLSKESKSEESEREEPEVLQLLLLSESGELLRFEAHAIEAIRPLDPVVRERLEAALAAGLQRRSSRHQLLGLDASPRADKAADIALGYLAETPVWRPSYRLLLEDPKQPEKALLQAWALLHNDTDESWRGVRVELANGQPVSFLFPLTAPRYGRRELRTPERELSSVPQLSTTTPDAMWGDFSDYEGEVLHSVGDEVGIGLGGIGTIGHGSGAGGLGLGGSGFASHGVDDGFEASDLIVLGDLTREGAAAPVPSRAISVFKLERPIDLAPHHSAMVPFLSARLHTRALVWFDRFGAEAERAVVLRNDTDSTLAAGSLAVFGGGGFLGEAEIDQLKPGERRFARIGRDPEIELALAAETSSADEQRLSFEDASLHVHQLRARETRFSLLSRSERTREVYVALAVRSNARVEGADRLDYDARTGTAFAVFDVAPGAQRSLRVITREGLARTTSPDTLRSEEVVRLIALNAVPDAERAVLRRALVELRALEVTREQKRQLGVEIAALLGDVTRLREHLSELGDGKGSDGAQSQLVKTILAREERLSELRAQERALDAERERKEQALALALVPTTSTTVL
jgi:transposase-like protein